MTENPGFVHAQYCDHICKLMGKKYALYIWAQGALQSLVHFIFILYLLILIL